ncbi:XTP/dITP diphosphatase [Clostridium tarantellae]|uniref:dITP/XTP pyrophosphatase n=1 Tax=Clostridium tarantellae TaxID=39493 RepID=A0A6I1MPC5_9CLOT|nr:XTP/dITP diphosphatase [Clostridium tarantellae]MPQ44924.1 XTP/dITP diphosphatase [Clostridium tarantellae]
MKKLIIASNNKNKVYEIKELLKDLKIEILSLKEAKIDVDVEEDGSTFQENSYKKAKQIKEILNNKKEEKFIVMADDSGLEVDCLNGNPGVYSARYAGEHGNDKKNNEKLLEELKHVKDENRKANFTCCIVMLTDDGEEMIAEGKSYGFISRRLIGKEAFGYDPLFYVPELKKTFAEMTLNEKNSISHRGRALKIVKEKLKQYLEER